MTIINQLLLLNKATEDLPKELTECIKEFLFQPMIEKTKKNKKQVIEQMNTDMYRIWTTYSGEVMIHYKRSRIYCGFCKNCGDYMYSYSMTRYLCRCVE